MRMSYNKLRYLCIIFFVHLMFVHISLHAAVNKSEHIYRSPEERREAGLKSEITDWLTFSGLLEVERVRESQVYVDNLPDLDINDDTEALQLGFEAEFTENIKAELVYELEKDEQNKTHSLIEEAILIIEVDAVELEIGRQTVPFGEYYSHFISDPLLAFGEKLDDSIIITFEASDNIDLALFVSEGRAAEAGENSRDWGANVELRNVDESIKVSIAYLSDLADTDELLLQDFVNAYQKRVAAWNINALFGFQSYEITAEFVAALDSFAELDAEISRPVAFNVELAYFPSTDIRFALRAENSKELEDAAAEQYGISSTFVFARSMTLSIEYLTGRYKHDFVFDDNDLPFDKIETFALQLGFAF